MFTRIFLHKVEPAVSHPISLGSGSQLEWGEKESR